ncbi:MAG: hypothetical protein H8D87_11180 [Deltaproteobacteria bacterium]|uniref:hypothetical protein n=1 Tax=Desulfobacula sp. TaxID=2593537 RepID=UPI0019C4058B|nr:hypothetical protein [Candidatus Desulfobacula maris]MBL6994557.1 hypothetical protein [Desulfobacula sp.]
MILPFDDFLNKKNLYRFNSSFNIDAPLELIWNELINYKKWPDWCKGLQRIEPLDQFDHLQKGNNIRSVWKGALPYTIVVDAVVRDFIQYSFLSFAVTGDLYGEGRCYFLPSRDNTIINFIWNVSPTKLWMKMSSPFARSVFIENHDQIVEQAVTGFTRRIEQKLGFFMLNNLL